MNTRLFLLDGFALIYRAYYAFIRNPRITSSGEDVSAIFGFINTLIDLRNRYEPTHIAVAFDLSGPTFRHTLFPAYKANRDETPEAIRYAVPIIKDVLKSMEIDILELQGYEADDVIGTVAHMAKAHFDEIYMVTPDKDYAQLVDKNVFMLKPARGGGEPVCLDVAQICQDWSITDIDQVRDILGLAGDTSDNIPGVPGIGPKTAQKLIATYGSMENLLEHTNELKGKQKENLETFREQALLSKELVTIKCDVPLSLDLNDIGAGKFNTSTFRSLLQQLEFKTLEHRLFEEDTSPHSADPSPAQTDLFDHSVENASRPEPEMLEVYQNKESNYHLIDTNDQCAELIAKLKKTSQFCFDIETSSLDVKQAEIIGISFSIEPHEAWMVYFPEDTAEAEMRLRLFESVFSDETIDKIGQNIKYDLSVLLWHGIPLRGRLIDTMVAHYLLDPDQRHNLDIMAQSILKYKTITFSELVGDKKNNQISLRDVPTESLAIYACEDADITLRLWTKLQDSLNQQGLREVFDQIEMPLLPVLAQMEYRGITVDRDMLDTYSMELGNQLTEMAQSIYTFAGMEFNINSPKQLGEVLFDLLKLSEKPKKTKTGQYQTNEEVLNELRAKHPIIPMILTYRQLTKLKSTYVDSLPEEIVERSGRVHTTFSQTVTSTGRLSSSNPNIQNIPIRTAEGREIRKAFIPEKPYTLLACDYSQIELRIMAELSGDQGLMDAFANAEDIHQQCAARVYKVKPDEVTREMRNKAKMVNFGIIYGISSFGLSQRLGISRSEASELITQYHASYPGVQDYLNKTIRFAEERGYVETVTGRRRYIRDILAKNKMVRAGAERTAINAPIQGTAADMIKIAMVQTEDYLRRTRAASRLLLQVHDELVFELAPDEKDELIPHIEQIMKDAIPMQVPIVVESGTGSNWLQAH